MNQYRVSWYDHNTIILTDIVWAKDEESAKIEGFKMHNGSPPSPFCHITLVV